MPIRKEGTPIFYYDETSQEWLEGTISKYIRGFGYTIDAEVDGETQELDVVSSYIKTAKPTAGRTRARSRSRSRSRSMSRRSVAPVIQENDNQNEAEEPLKSRLEDETPVEKGQGESEPSPKKSPAKSPGRGRGRPKSRRSLVDWAWENVEGDGEKSARDRRSLSRERKLVQQEVGEIVQEPEENEKAEETKEPESDETAKEEPTKEVTIEQCPWYVGVRDATHAILLVLLLPVITLKYYDLTNGSAMLTDLITWRQYWTSQPFIFLAAAFILLNRLKWFQTRAIYLGTLALGIAIYTQLAPQDYVWKWIPMCAAGHLVTVYALSAYVFKRHLANVENATFIEKLKLFVVGAETTCRVQDDLAQMGNLVGILISTYYMVNINFAHIGATLSAVYLSSSMFLNMATSVKVAGSFGFRSIFKNFMFVPFISTLMPRLAYNNPTAIDGEFYLIYVSILFYLIGLCQKLSSVNRSVNFELKSDALILSAAVLLGPINVISASLVIMCAALY